jgi:hypothetical protein
LPLRGSLEISAFTYAFCDLKYRRKSAVFTAISLAILAAMLSLRAFHESNVERVLADLPSEDQLRLRRAMSSFK